VEDVQANKAKATGYPMAFGTNIMGPVVELGHAFWDRPH
jgi:hypothetical protein